jgi:hypothetical protein
MLARNESNIGGQSLMPLKDMVISRTANRSQDKYLVETIRLDDLVSFLPKHINTSVRQQAIMKIDIEGFEPYAFQGSLKLFEAVDICVIFMEWGRKIYATKKHVALIDKMIKFLKQRKMQPFNDTILLEGDWDSWGRDIVWKKIGC